VRRWWAARAGLPTRDCRGVAASTLGLRCGLVLHRGGLPDCRGGWHADLSPGGICGYEADTDP
jgi:hypothetical protein